jgi:hypothetical protein
VLRRDRRPWTGLRSRPDLTLPNFFLHRYGAIALSVCPS